MSRITDDEIREAWAKALDVDTRRTSEEAIARMRAHLEQRTDPSITAIRDRLGGWERVWASLLKDLRLWPNGPAWQAEIGDPVDFIRVVRTADDWRLRCPSIGKDILLVSPADLRERVEDLRRGLGPEKEAIDA